MAENNSTTKAQRAAIAIGNISINVYMLPDGSYRLAGRNITDAIEARPGSLTEKMGVKSLKDLPSNGLSLYEKSSIKSVTGESFIPVSIDIAVQYWRMMDKAGNELAGALIDALIAESIERRADAAFGKIRSEEEYNERIKSRMASKIARRSLTDAIADYIERHPELSDNTKRWLYKNATDKQYKLLFNKTCKQLIAQRGTESLRDTFTTLENITITGLEDLSSRLIDSKDINPMEAIAQACERMMVEHRFIEEKISE